MILFAVDIPAVRIIPFICWAVADVDIVEAYMLLLVEVLPIMFPITVGEPPLIYMPLQPCDIAVEAVKVIDPIILFLISTVPEPEYEIRLATPPLFVCRFTAIDPFPVPEPIVLPEDVPILALPPDTQIPEKFPLAVEALEFVLTEKFLMVFP